MTIRKLVWFYKCSWCGKEHQDDEPEYWLHLHMAESKPGIKVVNDYSWQQPKK